MLHRLTLFLENNKKFFKLIWLQKQLLYNACFNQFNRTNMQCLRHKLLILLLISNKFACGRFIDLQTAFDIVNHKMLLSKLEYYSIPECPHSHNSNFQHFSSN